MPKRLATAIEGRPAPVDRLGANDGRLSHRYGVRTDEGEPHRSRNARISWSFSGLIR